MMHTRITLSTFTGAVRDMIPWSKCSHLLLSVYHSLFPITYLDNLSIVSAFWTNLAKPVQPLSLTEATVGVWECCLGMYPNTHIVFSFFPNLICKHFACEGLQQLGEYLQGVLTTVCSPYILKIYHCTSLSVLPAAAAAGGCWEQNVPAHSHNIYIKMSYHRSLKAIILVILVWCVV